jgi:Mn2+/Fe2+ NRAMP family transporter
LNTSSNYNAPKSEPSDIDSAAPAAESLRPIAGEFASLLFSLGIVGTGLLALPVLAGAAAYAVGEALRWPVGLGRWNASAGHEWQITSRRRWEGKLAIREP